MATRTGFIALTGCGLAAAVVLSGCGAQGSAGTSGAAGSPKEQVSQAFGNLASSSGVGLEFTLDGTLPDLQKINAALPKDERESDADLKETAVVLDGSITANVSAPQGKTLADGIGSSSASVKYQDASLLDVASVGSMAYLRTDTQKIAEMYDFDVAELKTLFADWDASISGPGNALLDGTWVSLDLKKTEGVLREEKLLEDLSGMALPDSSKSYDLLQSLQASFDRDAQVAQNGDGYRVTVPAKKVAQAVADDLIALTGDETGDEFREEIAGMKERDVVFDVTLDGDKLSGVNVDVAQFLDNPPADARLALDVKIDAEAETVQAPTDATEIDVKAVIDALRRDGL
ncbi:hypothetical protein [Kineosporia succinea]|uniref:Lipoprotein n=1 Tax=Kineosporia succinea TaxID=84632 RepID=A0ABT9PF31_9ACTN|nr:hypothetical protein [Kineosporia succinea]MDP9830999.1 hypothetical protein [Kineosporia succinea]